MNKLSIATDLGSLLRRILVFEQHQPLQSIADGLRISLSSFGNKLRNGGRFSPDEIAILLHLVPDERLPRWFFAGSGLLLVRKVPASAVISNMTLLQRTATCATQAISTICELTDFLDVPMLSGQQMAATKEHLERAQADLLAVKLSLGSLDGDRPATTDDAPGEAFHQRVRRVLIEEGDIPAKALAAALGLRPETWKARITGRVPFLPVEIRELFRVFPDPRCADYLLTGTPYTAIPRPAIVESRMSDGPIRCGVRSLNEIVACLEILLLADTTLPQAARMAVDRRLDCAVRHLATLQWNMSYIGRSAAPRNHLQFADGTRLPAS